jgi:hypothetical protein
MNLSTIVLTKEFNHKINDILDEQLLIVKDRYLKLLFNYSISLNKKKKKEIIFNLYMFFKNQFKEDIMFYYCFCFNLYKSNIIIEANDKFINGIKYDFKNNYLKESSIANIQSLSSLLIIYGYYMINQKENSKSIKQFYSFLRDLKRNRIIIIYLKLLNLIFKDEIEINENIYNFNEYKIDCGKITSKELETKFSLFFKIIVSLIGNNINDEISKIEDNNKYLDIIYQSLDKVFNIIFQTNNKYTKEFFSSKNSSFAKFMFYELSNLSD